MAWRDRLRRRAAGPIAADPARRTERSGADAGGPSGEGPDPSASDGPVSSVPGDWDGGWRRTPPPVLTVSRAPRRTASPRPASAWRTAARPGSCARAPPPRPLVAARSASGRHPSGVSGRCAALGPDRPVRRLTVHPLGRCAPLAAAPRALSRSPRARALPELPGLPEGGTGLPSDRCAVRRWRRAGPPPRPPPAPPRHSRPPLPPGAPAAPAPPAQPTASPSGAPAAARGNPVPPVREPARPTQGRSAVAPATAPIQRAAAVRPGPEGPGLRTTGSAASVQRVPVVRPAPPHPETPGPGAHAPSTAVPTRALPVTAPQAPPLADRPSAASAPAPAATVPVVRRRSAGPGGVTGGTATPVQRTGSGAGDRVPPGGPAKAVPAPGRQRSASVSASATGSASAATSASARSAAQRAEPALDPGLDLDDLARRLLDPVARLLRAELRRGRERTGRPHDGRR
ncbi:hypothetical protein SGLAM104S_03743 [Streptomyces glaucescens]